MYAFIKLTDLLGLPVLLAETAIVFSALSVWEADLERLSGGIIMRYKEKQAISGRALGAAVGDDWMYRG